MGYDIIKSDTKYHGWTRLLVLDILLPNGQVIRREIEDHGNAAAVLPYDPGARTAILVQQFRAPVFYRGRHKNTVEAIAGIQDEPDSAATARREAIEEAGIELQSLECIGNTWTMPGISTEKMALYLATYRRSADRKPHSRLQHEQEGISVIELELVTLENLLETGQIEDMKTLVLVQALKLRHPDLFK